MKKINGNLTTTICAFRALVLFLHGNQRLDEKIPKVFTSIIDRRDGVSPNQFNGFQMNDIPIVEGRLTLNILLYDIDIVDGNLIGELARRSVQNYDNIVRLLRYNNLISYVGNIIAVFQSPRCPDCDTFLSRTFNLEQLSTT